MNCTPYVRYSVTAVISVRKLLKIKRKYHTLAEVDLENMREKSVGRVVKSFYNEFDGAWWVELIADEPGIEAIEKGWGVSNAYLPTEMKPGGEYHNIRYDKEVVNGRYDHLAIVPNPRYEEAVIMTPEEYEEYNESRKQEILKLKNSKENEMEISEEKLAELLTNAADSAVAKYMGVLANEKKKNAIEDKRRLVREIGALESKPDSDFEGGEDEKWRTITKLAEELAYDKSEDDGKDNSKRNESDGEKKVEEKKENETPTSEKKEEKEKKDEEEKKENSKFFSIFKNAKNDFAGNKKVSTMGSGLALGKARYGSKEDK